MKEMMTTMLVMFNEYRDLIGYVLLNIILVALAVNQYFLRKEIEDIDLRKSGVAYSDALSDHLFSLNLKVERLTAKVNKKKAKK